VKLVRDLERPLEQLVEGVAGKVFRGSVHPAELAAQIVRESDLTRREGPLGPVAPNEFAVHLSPKDVTELTEAGVINRELEHAVEITAIERGWRLEGPARVWLEADDTVTAGMVRIGSTEVPGQRAAWATLIGPSTELAVTVNRCVIGRSSDADVTIPIDSVSRRHAMLWQEDGTSWMYDLGSANGTFVDGAAASEPIPIVSGQRVRFGATPFVVQVA
jgi:hypothetical protein